MGNMLPFDPAESVDDVNDTSEQWTGLLGHKFHTKNGRCYRLFRLNAASGFAGGKKLFKRSDYANFDVEPATAATDVVCGIGDEAMTKTVDDNDLVLLIVGPPGEVCTVIDGDSGGNFVKGEGVIVDTDSDTGKAAGSGAYTDDGIDFAVANAASSTTDADVEITLKRWLT